MWPSNHKYDVFISHAVEDKIAVANELCLRLEQAGLRVWYSGRELALGDSVDKTIRRGLERSRRGVVIFSHIYLQKNWTMKEFYILLGRELQYRKVVLPVLYNITIEELAEREIFLADRWAVSFNPRGMDYVVEKILLEVKGDITRKRTFWEFIEDNSYALSFWFFVMLILGLATFIVAKQSGAYPSDELINALISDHVVKVERLAKPGDEGIVVSADKADKMFNAFADVQSGYRNEYEFYNGVQRIRSKKQVEQALHIDLATLVPEHKYNFTAPDVGEWRVDSTNRIRSVHYAFFNQSPVSFDITEENSVADGEYEVTVHFRENIRKIDVDLTFPDAPQSLKRHQMKLTGFLPVEKFLFVKEGKVWVLKEID